MEAFLKRCRSQLNKGNHDGKPGIMILKEDNFVQAGQEKHVRSDDWYQNIFRECGFHVALTKLHDREHDGYNDEMLYCI